MPYDPGIDGPEAQFPGLCPNPQTGVVLENPGDLGAREVRGKGQTGGVAKAIHAIGGTETLAELGSAGVLPDDGVVNRLACFLVPDHGGFPLVGDTHRGEIGGLQVDSVECSRHHPPNLLDDLNGVVLHPAGLRKDLAVFLLSNADDPPGFVEHDEPGTGGALIDGADQIGTHRIGANRSIPFPSGSRTVA